MSYLVCTMKKMKKDNLFGIQKHNQRESEKHNNKDIDKNKSDLNYDLVNENKINLSKKVFDLIEKRRESKKAIRKDAVLLDEFIISSDRDFFKNMNGNEIEKFFETSKQFFADRYGEENIISANVHLDEITPHMHLGVCPLRDGRLQSKNIFNRVELRKIQDELPQALIENGFDIERGVKGSTRKHTETKVFKAYEEKRLKELEEKNRELELKIARRRKELETVKSECSDMSERVDSYKAFMKDFMNGESADILNHDITYKEGLFDVKMNCLEFAKFKTQISEAQIVAIKNKKLKNENDEVYQNISKVRKSQSEFSGTFRNYMDKLYDNLDLDMEERFKDKAAKALVECETGDFNTDNTLYEAVMDSKALSKDSYDKYTKEKEKPLKEPIKYFDLSEMDW